MCVQFDMLELDKFAKPLVSCPLLLDSASYFPDTEDLTTDQEARHYWLSCFVDATEKVYFQKQWTGKLTVIYIVCAFKREALYKYSVVAQNILL